MSKRSVFLFSGGMDIVLFGLKLAWRSQFKAVL